jgi:hypothetical protein
VAYRREVFERAGLFDPSLDLPAGLLRVPSAALSALEKAVAPGMETLPYMLAFAQDERGDVHQCPKLRMPADVASALNYPSNGVYHAVAVSSQSRSHLCPEA